MKIIAVTQVWGAATGTWLIVPQLAEWGPGTRLVVPLLLIALPCFYTLLGVTALLVLRNRKAAIFWLAAAQLPQLILIQTPDFLYRVLAGAFVVLRAGGGELGFDVGVTSEATIRWGDLGLSTGFGLNILAAGTLWYLAVVDPWAEYERGRFPMRAEDQLGHSGRSKRE